VQYVTVPLKLADDARIPNMQEVRIWGDDAGASLSKILHHDITILKNNVTGRASAREPVASNLLALSGGGDDGAFGAGLLAGWTEHGTRPKFDLVTGVSAGGLAAPFAFLGSEYDREMTGVFTKHGGEDIYQANVLSGVLGGEAVADNAPLARLIAHYVDDRMLARIAEERAKGRFLLIGTTNLNAQRPVFWDMGRIAQQRTPEARALFRNILLASAALPGIFPPVHLEVTAAGKTYYETHVDGGPTRQLFLSPADFSFRDIDKAVGKRVQRRLWIIRNGKTTPEYAIVNDTAIAIAARSLETLTKNQGIGDLIRIYDKARVEGIDYNLAAIPPEFKAAKAAPFDRKYMTALFETGRTLGRVGFRWEKAPPGVEGVR